VSARLPVDAVVIGECVRKDLGDLDAMADSIAERGLLYAMVVKPDNTLVAGERRLRACMQLGWTEIPVRVLDVADLLSAERAENEVRKDFTPSDAIVIARVIDEAVKEQNKARRK
jgi:ParB family chromosome partitioning protein